VKKKCSVFWFRRDLRLEDNKGLHEALKAGEKVLCFFIFDKNILDKLNDRDDARLGFIHSSLENIKSELKELGSDLFIHYGVPKEGWSKICSQFDIQAVYYNEDYEPYAIKRDKEVAKILKEQSIDFFGFKDQVIFAKNEILKSDGKPYTVYTPFKRRWLETLTPKDLASVNNKKYFNNFLNIKDLSFPSLKKLGFEKSSIFIPSSKVKKSILESYDKTRDIPSINGTSLLGIHLRFGTVSVRRLAQKGFELNDTWLSELIWREFFMQILWHFPHVTQGAFREKYNKIKWKNDKKEFEKWCQGKTGYPLVDAGMRELNQTGHMHNRVRMLAASFLVKHLLIDWRWGEKYFASKLLDFDLASNNGNWQWVAGTGCDAAPYFRIFNPETQQKKFDPDFVYITKWVPEYGTESYPGPMVDHKMAYNRALATYKRI
jgi:deoxyribodipyrimidine photo-lyase